MEQEFSCRRLDNKVIRGKFYIPDENGSNVAKPYPTAVSCHGYGANYRLLEQHGRGMAQEGICCLLFDFCGGGPESYSDGSMLEMSVKTERDDLLCVFEALKSYDFVDKDRLFLMGESQGGYVAGTGAILLQDSIAGLILWYPAFMIPEYTEKHAAEGFPDTLEIMGHTIGRIYGEDAIKEHPYQDMPSFKKDVLIIHGDRDDIVPLEYSKKALCTYPHAKLEIMPGAYHGFMDRDSDRARKLSISFIKSHSGRPVGNGAFAEGSMEEGLFTAIGRFLRKFFG